tara:strand:+ start:221 stop:427 length:207 start_codon:yes stop_codon:yes gene_type:complete
MIWELVLLKVRLLLIIIVVIMVQIQHLDLFQVLAQQQLLLGAVMDVVTEVVLQEVTEENLNKLLQILI